MAKSIEELEKKAKPGSLTSFDIEVLKPEVEKLKAGDVYLEVGVYTGRALSIARMIAKPKVLVVGVDSKSDPKVKNTIFYQGDSTEVAKRYKQGPISLLFINNEHRYHTYEGCKKDIQAWYPHMKKSGVMLFHDCEESAPGVLQAVAEFVNTRIVQKFVLFKRADNNTSMAKIQL